MLAPGFVYEVDEVGATKIVPAASKRAGCYYTRAKWRAEEEASNRRYAAVGVRNGPRLCVTYSDASGQIHTIGPYFTWKDVVEQYGPFEDTARAVWFDEDRRPTVFRVLDGQTQVIMSHAQCVALAKNAIEGG